MKLSVDSTPKKRGRLKSTEILVETEERSEVEFSPRRDVPSRLWEEIEKRAEHTSIPDLKSNIVTFILRLLSLSIIDEKIKDLLLSRNDLIQFELNRLPIVTDPEKHGVTPGYLGETANLLQIVPELGAQARKREKPGSDGYKWWIEKPLDDMADYVYWSKQPKTEDQDPEWSLTNGLEGSVAAMRLFPADSSELRRSLLGVITPDDLLNEAGKNLESGRVEFALHILAYARILFPEKTGEYQEMAKPYWGKLKSNLQKETPFHGWPYAALHATLVAAYDVWINEEGKIVIQLEAPKPISRKTLPERDVA